MPPDDAAPPPAGTEAPAAPPAAPAAPPAPDQTAVLQQQVQQMAARLAQQDAIIQAAATQSSGRSQQPPAEDDYIDPSIERRLTKAEKALQERLNAQAERLDYAEFTAEVVRAGLDDADRKAAEEVYQAWRQRGITISGEPPSRQDALKFAMGQKYMGTAHKTRAEKAAEEQRRMENAAAFVERPGGRAIRAAGGMDPDKMSRKERLEKYYPAELGDVEI